MLKIGEFSKLSRISIQMLRHYDEIGLLAPAVIDPENGYRYYEEAQLPTANRIQACKGMGLGLRAIREMLSGDEIPYADILLTHRDQLQAEINRLQQQLRFTQSDLEAIQNGTPMPQYAVALQEIPGMRVACYRRTLPAYDREGELWAVLHAALAAQRIAQTNPPYHLAVFHDESFMPGAIDVEVCCAVERPGEERDGIFFSTRAPVLAATVVFQGDYTRLTDVNVAIAAWLAEHGYRLCAPGFNIYHIAPDATDQRTEMVTEVCYPVCPV